MTEISAPEVTTNIIGANQRVANSAHKTLVIGQKVAAGSQDAGELVENIQNDNAWDNLFGPNSQIAGAIRDYRKINDVSSLDAICLDDDGGGVNAAGSIAFTGPATEDGTMEVVIGSERNFTFEIIISETDSADDIGQALEDEVNANLNCPVTATNASGTVTLECDNAGTVGNGIGLKVSGLVAGVTFTLTAMAGGAGDPTLTDVFDPAGDERYQTVIWPYADTTELRAWLDDRFNVDDDVLDGIGINSQTDTLANLLSLGGTLNSQSLITVGDASVDDDDFKGPAQLEIPYSKAAQTAAVRSLRLTVDANIADIVDSSNGALDSFGGPAIASLPYHNTPMSRLPIIDVNKGFTKSQVKQLRDAGISVIGNNSERNTSILGSMVTTYKTDNAGNPDISFTFANYVDTSSNCREFFTNNMKKRFSQSRLTNGDLVRGRNMANRESIATFLDGLYKILSGPNYVLLQKGEEALQFFKDNRTVTLDLSQGKVTITMKVPIVTQLRVIIATMQIAFSTTG